MDGPLTFPYFAKYSFSMASLQLAGKPPMKTFFFRLSEVFDPGAWERCPKNL